MCVVCVCGVCVCVFVWRVVCVCGVCVWCMVCVGGVWVMCCVYGVYVVWCGVCVVLSFLHQFSRGFHAELSALLLSSRKMVFLDVFKTIFQTHDQKIANPNPGRSIKRIFFSRVNFVC